MDAGRTGSGATAARRPEAKASKSAAATGITVAFATTREGTDAGRTRK